MKARSMGKEFSTVDRSAGLGQSQEQVYLKGGGGGRGGVQAWLGGSVALEHHPVHQKIAVSIPGQGTDLGCRFNSRWGANGRQPKDIFSLISFSFSASLSKINEHILL